jgi:hypothetical protein
MDANAEPFSCLSRHLITEAHKDMDVKTEPGTNITRHLVSCVRQGLFKCMICLILSYYLVQIL